MAETPPPQAPAGDDLPPHVRALFRTEALEQYRHRHREALAPPSLSSPRLALLWGALLVLLGGAAAVGLLLRRLLISV